jgi:hypothetical protein
VISRVSAVSRKRATASRRFAVASSIVAPLAGDVELEAQRHMDVAFPFEDGGEGALGHGRTWLVWVAVHPEGVLASSAVLLGPTGVELFARPPRK